MAWKTWPTLPRSPSLRAREGVRVGNCGRVGRARRDGPQKQGWSESSREVDMREPKALISTGELAPALGQPNLRIYDCTTYLEPTPAGSEDPYVAVPGTRSFDAPPRRPPSGSISTA